MTTLRVPTGTDRLAALRDAIVAAYEARLRARGTSQAHDHAIKLGKLLTEARALVAVAGWLPWVGANLPFSYRAASRYVKDAQDAAHNGSSRPAPDRRARIAAVLDDPEVSAKMADLVGAILDRIEDQDA